MELLKKALKSRTVQLAIAQAVLGIVVAVLTELDLVGWVTVVKSIADIALRFDTTSPISAK